jgi:hypothetical protein
MAVGVLEQAADQKRHLHHQTMHGISSSFD